MNLQELFLLENEGLLELLMQFHLTSNIDMIQQILYRQVYLCSQLNLMNSFSSLFRS